MLCMGLGVVLPTSTQSPDSLNEDDCSAGTSRSADWAPGSSLSTGRLTGVTPSASSASTYWFTLRKALATRIMPEWTPLNQEEDGSKQVATSTSHSDFLSGDTLRQAELPEGMTTAHTPRDELGRLIILSVACVPLPIAVFALGKTFSDQRRDFARR